jgi:hypothetical protein
MRTTTAGRKLIACCPKTDAEGGVQSTLRGAMRKDRQQMVDSKAGAEEIGGTLRIRGESLSETPMVAPKQSAKQPTNQTNKTGKKKKKKKRKSDGAEAWEKGNRRSRT